MHLGCNRSLRRTNLLLTVTCRSGPHLIRCGGEFEMSRMGMLFWVTVQLTSGGWHQPKHLDFSCKLTNLSTIRIWKYLLQNVWHLVHAGLNVYSSAQPTLKNLWFCTSVWLSDGWRTLPRCYPKWCTIFTISCRWQSRKSCVSLNPRVNFSTKTPSYQQRNSDCKVTLSRLRLMERYLTECLSYFFKDVKILLSLRKIHICPSFFSNYMFVSAHKHIEPLTRGCNAHICICHETWQRNSTCTEFPYVASRYGNSLVHHTAPVI